MRSVPEISPLSEASSTEACSSRHGLFAVFTRRRRSGEHDFTAAAVERAEPTSSSSALICCVTARLTEIELLRCAPEAALRRHGAKT